MASRRVSVQHHTVLVLLLLLRVLADASEQPVKVGHSLYLRVKRTGASITVENYNGEDRSVSVHAQFWHRGLWQELKVDKDGGKEGDLVESGDAIHLRGHNGGWIEVVGEEVRALSREQPPEGLIIEKESGAGPIHIGDTIYLKAPTGKYISVRHMDVHAGAAGKGPEEAMVVDTHMVGPWDGRWTFEDAPGQNVFVIQGSTLHFVDDIEFGMFPQGGNKFTTGLQGWHAHDGGELVDGKIVWTNGDVWIPTVGDFDGRWTDSVAPGSKIFLIEGKKLKVLGGAETEIEELGNDKFKTVEASAPNPEAELVGAELHWGNGDIWVQLAAGPFDGRWTVKANPGGDFFDIEGDMLFFDAGLESRMDIEGPRSFSTELRGDQHHCRAELSKDGTELHWNNGDVWSRLRLPMKDFWVPPELLVDTSTTTTYTTATGTKTSAATTTTTTTVTATTTTSTTVTITSTTTTTTLAVTTTTTDTATTTTVTRMCFEPSVAYEPLDMDTAGASFEETVEACQARCARTPLCTHFSYWSVASPGHCHLQDIYALRSSFRLGFVAGPPHCYTSISHENDGLVKLEQEDVGPDTYVPYAYRCLKMSRMYAPIMHTEPMTKEKGYETGRKAVKGCRELCLNTTGCSFYAVGFPARLCSLAPADANEVKSIIKHVAGPVTCSVTDASDEVKEVEALNTTIDMFLAAADEESSRHHALRRVTPALYAGLVACSLAALSALLALWRSSVSTRRPRRQVLPTADLMADCRVSEERECKIISYAEEVEPDDGIDPTQWEDVD